MSNNEKLTFNTEKFTFKIPAEVDANDIVDLLCTAFDGDMVSAWSPRAETVLPEGFDIYKIPWLKDPSSWAETRKCYIAPLVEGGSVILCDFEDALDSLRKGFITHYNVDAEAQDFATIKDVGIVLPLLTDDYTEEQLLKYVELANAQE